jgi:NAD(P)-dependent dehydrogenase (short-subunit alcohol dehydrogenase family)
MQRFSGKVALVTGGTGGIGRAAAVAWAREGARVVVAGRRAAEGSETVRLVEQAGAEGLFVAADVSREADAKRMVEAALERFGRLDVAFNNAGIEGTAAPLAEQSEQDFDRVFAVNVKGVWLAMKYEIPAMLKTGGGAIVNNSSIGGLVGMPRNGIYSASKHAVCGLTRSASLDYAAKGVRVNAVAPGGVQTDMLDRVTGGAGSDYRAKMARLHPLGRIGTPEEIVAAVLWLCSPEASFVHGHVLSVDGGFTAR